MKKNVIIGIVVAVVVLILILCCVGFSSKKTEKNNEFLDAAKVTMQKFEALEPYQSESIGAMPYLLAELNLATREELDALFVDSSDPIALVKTNVKYDDFKAEMLKYISEEFFTNAYYPIYANMEGYVGIQNVAASFITVTVLDAELVSEENGKYTVKFTIRDDEMYDHAQNGENISEEDYLFERTAVLKYVGNNLVVDEVK